MKKKYNDLRGLIIGCGSIGTRHLHNLKSLGIENIILYDENKKKLNEISKKYNVQKADNLNSAFDFKPDFSIICTYPGSHLKIAEKCLSYNSHMLIEKPLSIDLFGLEKFLKKAKSKNIKVGVGYNLRFDKGLIQIKKFLNQKNVSKPLTIFCQWGHTIKKWHPGTQYSNHYILKKGGGIILDDSHEYDYLRWILGEDVISVFCSTRKSSKIKTQTESNAVIVLKFKSGVIANLILDYVRPTYQRNCQFIGDDYELRWDFIPKSSGWKDYSSKSISQVFFNKINKKTVFSKIINETNQMYLDEMKNFLDSILFGTKLMTDGTDALKTLKIGLAALQSSKSKKIIEIKY